MLVELPHFPRAPAEIVWKLRQPSQANRSEFTGARRVTILAEAPRWTAQVKYPPIIGERYFMPWRAALAALQGRAGTFKLSPCEGHQRMWYVSGTAPALAGSDQRGTLIQTKGWVRGQWFPAGSFVTIADRLHQLVHSFFADQQGNGEMAIVPYIAGGLPDGTEIQAAAPYAVMSLTDDEAGWTVGAGQKYDLSFNCEEAH